MKIKKNITSITIEEKDLSNNPSAMLCSTAIDYVFVPTELYDKWKGSDCFAAVVVCLRPEGKIIKI